MSGVSAPAGEKYISLTTFKTDGTPVATPVWVVGYDGRRLLVWTGLGTWKVKRLRSDPRVIVSASDLRGRTRGESYDGWDGCSTSRREASWSRYSTGSTA